MSAGKKACRPCYPGLMYLRSGLILFLAAILFSGCGPDKRIRIIKLAHVLNVDHPVHKSMVFLARRIEEKSAGRMRLDIYPGGQLGQERDLIELLQIGSLAMTKVSSAPLESFVPEMKIFGIPYLFRDEVHRWNVLSGPIGRRLLLAGQDYHLRGIGYYDAGSRSFYTKDKPIQTPDDLRGLKIRVMKSITSVQMVQSLGGSATPISWGELYTALQQGVVDGAENNPPSFYTSRHYEVCKYYSLDEHTSPPDILLISTVVWQSLAPEEKRWLQEAVDESVVHQRRLWKEATELSLAEVAKAGVQILRPDKNPFLDSVRSMHDSYRGTPIYDLIMEIRNIQ